MNAIVDLQRPSGRASGLSVKRVAGRIGAIIGNVTLSGDLDRDTVEAIRSELHRHKVIFFRGQTHLDDAEQERFAGLLGTTETHPTVAARDGTRHVFELDSARGERANVWHTDVTFKDAVPYASVLRGELIPEYGGDTCWANTATAYQDLAPELRERVDGLWAVHSNQYDYLKAAYPTHEIKQASELEAIRHKRREFSSTTFEAEHPLVHVLPESGERALLLGGFTRAIIGLSAEEHAALFAKLQAAITRLENTVRWQWRRGDVAIWDNRATQHYAINDYGDQRRIVRRVSLAGTVPVGIDGRRSVQRTVDTPAAA